jgi:protein PhnA
LSISKSLEARSGNRCELCTDDTDLSAYEVSSGNKSDDQSVVLCSTCKSQILNPATIDKEHFRCLLDSMWSQTVPVQVLSYRLLKFLGKIDEAEMIYFEDDIKAWADSENFEIDDTKAVVHKDSNGTVLSQGDSVTLIKDLDVKGAGFTAKRGTIVKNIHLGDDPKFIEGKINGTQIVLVCAFMKKVI